MTKIKTLLVIFFPHILGGPLPTPPSVSAPSTR
jgi:hypothetical protein